MVKWIALSIFAGVIAGKYLLPSFLLDQLDTIITGALSLMVFCVGIDIGRNRSAWQRICTLGWKILMVPIAVAIGSLTGACVAKLVFWDMPLKELLAVGAGFGWYSLSGVLIADIYNLELGAVAFMSNVFREMIAFLIIPMLVGFVGKIVCIAPGGATTMDSTLPLISKVTDSNTVLIAFTNGLVLTLLVPVLIPAILAL